MKSVFGMIRPTSTFDISCSSVRHSFPIFAALPIKVLRKRLETITEEARQGSRLCGSASKVLFKSHVIMPKVKTNSSAKKRFKVTGTGKITHQKSFKRHILTKKSKKRKRNLRKDGEVAKANLDFVKRLLRLK